MKNLSKFLPILAIVVGMGSAWAFQSQDNPCTTEGTPGYQTPPNPSAGPEDPSNAGIVSLGQLESDFRCRLVQEDKCFWAYSPGHPEADENGWMECDGEYEPIVH